MKKKGTRALTSVLSRKICPKSKRSQMKLSFGMIFSIILIIIFLAFAFFAIRKFLGIQDNVKVAQFVDKIQDDVDKIWRGTQGSQEVEYFLPSKIQAVCFVDYDSGKRGINEDLYDKLKQVFFEYENMIFYPVGSGEGQDAASIEHIDIETITEEMNPFCLDVEEGKVKMRVQMESGESLVTITE